MKKFFSLFLLVVLAAVFLPAEEKAESPLAIGLAGIRVYWFGFVPTGLDLSLSYSGVTFHEGLDTIFWGKFGGGYQERTFFRNTDGSPVTPSVYQLLSDTEIEDLSYMQPNFQWELGLIQGILWNEDPDDNLVEAFLIYRGRYDYNIQDSELTQIIFDPAFFSPDGPGLFGNSILMGVSYDSISRSDHDTRSGIYPEGSVELGPSWFFNQPFGGTDYLQLNVQAKAFARIYDIDPLSRNNKLSIYFGDFFSVDYSTGDNIPIYVMTSFGGRKRRWGLGGSVRGFEGKSRDAQLKVVNNLELRINGPAIVLPTLIPGFLAFFDTGYYDGYFGDPNNTIGGFLASTGAGVFINVLNFDYLAAYFTLPLYGERLDRKRFPFSIDLGIHF